jgi:hypothetical protein
MHIKRRERPMRTMKMRTTNCIHNDRTVRRKSWILNLASTTLTDPLARTVVVVAAEEDAVAVEVANDAIVKTEEIAVIEETAEAEVPDHHVEASEESHEVDEELKLPMSTTNRLSPLWAKVGLK